MRPFDRLCRSHSTTNASQIVPICYYFIALAVDLFYNGISQLKRISDKRKIYFAFPEKFSSIFFASFCSAHHSDRVIFRVNDVGIPFLFAIRLSFLLHFSHSLSYLPTYIGTLLPIFLLRSSLPCSIPILFAICLSFFCFISLYYTYQPTSVHCYLYFSNICLYHV